MQYLQILTIFVNKFNNQKNRIMKKINLFLWIIAGFGLTFTSCKSRQRLVNIPNAHVEAKENTDYTKSKKSSEYAINTRDESFRLSDGDKTTFTKKFHVVVGSFGIKDNALTLSYTLKREGNNSIVVQNENEMYRVIIASYNDYNEAHSKINRIRNRFPDAWVLRQK